MVNLVLYLKPIEKLIKKLENNFKSFNNSLAIIFLPVIFFFVFVFDYLFTLDLILFEFLIFFFVFFHFVFLHLFQCVSSISPGYHFHLVFIYGFFRHLTELEVYITIFIILLPYFRFCFILSFITFYIYVLYSFLFIFQGLFLQ